MNLVLRLRIAALLVALLLPAVASAAEVDATSEVTRVVVYPDRARVTRSSTVQLSKGSHEILVAGLPTRIDTSSLRAEGEGTARVVLGALDVRRNYRSEIRDARARQLLERIQSLEDADRELADADEAARFELDFVKTLKAKAAVQMGEETLERGDVASEAESVVETLGRRYRLAQSEVRRVRVERRDLKSQLDTARSEYSQLSGSGTDDFRVAISVTAKSAGSLTLHLTYTTTGVSWRPTYDARLDPDASSVEMTYGAWVQQASGEDWNGVQLALSTARPALGLQAPPLPAWILRQSPPAPRSRPGRSRRSSSRGDYADEAMAEMDDDAGYAPAPEPEPVYEAEDLVAQATTSGTTVEFVIPGPVTVPGDSTRKRVTIAAWEVTGVALKYRATPETSAHVFQSATIANDRDWPLLAGELQAFMVDRYVGRSSIADTPAGAELTVPFGVEERLSVERELLEKGSGPKGAFGNKTSIQWKWKTELKSTLDREVTIELRQRAPVSEYTKTVVKMLDDTTPPDAEEGRGIQLWNVVLGAGATAEVRLSYAVAFPADEAPWGL